jgi:hypothetical protein
VRHPYLYNLLFAGMFSLFAGLVGVFTYSASFFVKRRHVFVVLLFFIINSALEVLSSALEGSGPLVAPFKYLMAYDISNKSLAGLCAVWIVMLCSISIMSFFGVKKLKNLL